MLQHPTLSYACTHVLASSPPTHATTCAAPLTALPLLLVPTARNRWTLCATDRCFKYAAAIPFFRAAKVLPVVRGAGMAQPGMLAAEERLAAGEWVHIFPEGTRSRDGKSLGPVRKGVGRLVASCPQLPLVVPFVHSGMETIMPRGSVVPAVGQQVRARVWRAARGCLGGAARSVRRVGRGGMPHVGRCCQCAAVCYNTHQPPAGA